MTTAEDPISTVATALRGAVDKAVDLMDSTHLHSLGDAGHEAASRVLAGTPDLPARLGSAPVDLHSLRVSTARRAHQLAHSIDDPRTRSPPQTQALTDGSSGSWCSHLLAQQPSTSAGD